MGPSWGHGFGLVTKSEAHQLPAQAARHRQREAARQGVCADRWRRPSARSLPSGTKTWRFKYHLNGKREKVTIGAYPAYTIKQARDRHEELRALVERGESPAKSKQASVAARKVAELRELTVRVFARRWIDETLFYRSPAYVAQIVRWLDAYIDPAIGDMQLADVQPGDVLAIIKAHASTPVTAERIRVIVQQFYNHAIRNLLVTTNPAQP